MVEVFLAFLRLGCMSFGGPAAHLGYFRDEFVRRRGWLTEEQFAQCIAISQMLPGPGSSQTGMLIGFLRARWPGALAAWVAFTLPSAVLMTAFALYAPGGLTRAGWLHGLLVAAAAIVATAVLTMSAALVRSYLHLAFAFGTLAAMLLLPNPATAPASIALCALLGALSGNAGGARPAHKLTFRSSRRAGIFAFVIFAALALGLPFAAAAARDPLLELGARLFDVGSLVFGGGHVVLPLLQSQVVSAHIASPRELLAGYAAAQAVPGPLFTLSSYIGAVAYGGAYGVTGALIGTVAIFAPSFFLLAAVLPFYDALARSRRFSRALAGANACVVGLLAAAFVTPIWSNAIRNAADGAFAAAAFCALALLRLPAWAVVALAAIAGALLFR